MTPEEALALLEPVKARVVEMEQELADLHGDHLCEKCKGDQGEEIRLVGGYEAILCRACRNDWAVVADESGHWLEYRKALAREKITRARVKFAFKRGGSKLEANKDVDSCVEDLIAIERKLFQLAAKWLAGADAP